MNIHQFQLQYDADADRVLVMVRTRQADVFRVWLTRRMALRFWPVFQQSVAALALDKTRSPASLGPQAQEMLADMARERELPHSHFGAPFLADGANQPLGALPLLACEIAISTSQQGLALRMKDAQGRSLQMQLDEELSLGLMRLLEQVLRASQWGVVAAEPTSADSAAPQRHLLN